MVGYGTTVSLETQGVEFAEKDFTRIVGVPELSIWIRFTSNQGVQQGGFLMEVERKHEQGMTTLLTKANDIEPNAFRSRIPLK